MDLWPLICNKFKFSRAPHLVLFAGPEQNQNICKICQIRTDSFIIKEPAEIFWERKLLKKKKNVIQTSDFFIPNLSSELWTSLKLRLHILRLKWGSRSRSLVGPVMVETHEHNYYHNGSTHVVPHGLNPIFAYLTALTLELSILQSLIVWFHLHSCSISSLLPFFHLIQFSSSIFCNCKVIK